MLQRLPGIGPFSAQLILLRGAGHPDFLTFAEVAYPNRIGPLVVPGAGHFLQWERADVFNPLVAATLLHPL